MEKLTILLLLAILILSTIGCQSGGYRLSKSLKPQLLASYKAQSTYPYYLYIPERAMIQEENSYPLLIFLHGSGERRDELDPIALMHGPLKPFFYGDMDSKDIDPQTLEELNDHVKQSFVLVPQVPLNEYWDVNKLNSLIRSIMEEYQVDRDRIYLTGLSMGGYGVWDYGSKYTNNIAALVPICGGYESDTPLSSELSIKPIWAFHSFNDPAVSRTETQDRIMNFLMGTNIVEPFNPANRFLTETAYPHTDGNSTKSAKGSFTLSWNNGTVLGWSKGSAMPQGTINYTVYSSNSHDSWTRTYDNKTMWKWLYSQRLNP
ncbi:MAG: hypothetical protein JEY91_00205 [Spirochaetaceae bacterium]|nr:hypothetical protein [Spirochaetaceae bacterium]